MSRLRRILSGEIFPVPHFENVIEYRYMIGFFDVRTGEELESVDGRIQIPFLNNSFSVEKDLLVAITTKGFKVPLTSWNSFKVIYVGDDKDSPENFIISPISPVEAKDCPGFYEIPGFSSYVINSKGELFSRSVRRILSPYRDQMGYWMYGLNPDVGSRTILGTHRLLALAFLEYPAEVDRMDVNHKNGIKSDNDLNNLEWASRKRNCDHAYSTGLRVDNVPVLVMNAFTKEVLEFYSFAECSRHMNLCFEAIRQRCMSKGQKLYYPGFLFKRKTDKEDWLQVEDPEAEFYKTKQPRPYLVKNLETGETHIARNAKECSKFIGLTAQYIPDKINPSGSFERNGYSVSFLSLSENAKSLFDEIRNR